MDANDKAAAVREYQAAFDDGWSAGLESMNDKIASLERALAEARADLEKMFLAVEVGRGQGPRLCSVADVISATKGIAEERDAALALLRSLLPKLRGGFTEGELRDAIARVEEIAGKDGDDA